MSGCVPTRVVSVLIAAMAGTMPEAVEAAEASNAGDDAPVEDRAEGDEVQGYPTPKRIIGTPLDSQTDLRASFPQPGAIFREAELTPVAKAKNWLYDEIGLQLGVSYQMLFQQASDASPDSDETALGGWFLFESRWELIDRGGDFMGTFVATIDARHAIGDLGNPGLFKLDLGSLWLTDAVFLQWDPYPIDLFWEQWLGKDFLVVRAGFQSPGASLHDFYRFKDPRVSFSGSPFALGVEAIPAGPPGPAVSFELWPIEDSELYLIGSISDINSFPGRFDWSGLDFGEFFYAVELGYNFRRGKGDFDHVHLMAFYADERTTPAPIPLLESEAGAGFKLRGTKQFGPAVMSGSYTFNDAPGGGFGVATARHSASASFAWMRPLNVSGEVALGLAWADPFNDDLRDQFGTELYWRMLIIPSLWLTPGVQTIFQPSFNPEVDAIVVGQLKFRLTL